MRRMLALVIALMLLGMSAQAAEPDPISMEEVDPANLPWDARCEGTVPTLELSFEAQLLVEGVTVATLAPGIHDISAYGTNLEMLTPWGQTHLFAYCPEESPALEADPAPVPIVIDVEPSEALSVALEPAQAQEQPNRASEAREGTGEAQEKLPVWEGPA